LNWHKIKDRKKKKQKSRGNTAFFVISKIMLTFAPVAVMRELSNFILTSPRPKIGALFYPFGAVLLLFHKKRTANPLSVSGLGGSIMFNPKKPRMYNERVTKG
jgi:hypothetical protein